MTLKKKLKEEIRSYESNEPDVKFFISKCGDVFWLTKDEHYVWCFHDNYEKYVDEKHQPEYARRPEGVEDTGVIWQNRDFESPIPLEDFLKRIETITV